MSSSRYTKKNPIDHVKDRPDMYIGSTLMRKVEELVIVDDENHIEKRDIEISPGIIRIFVEPLSNAIDNLARSKENKAKMTEIEVSIEEDGTTTFINDGDIVPIEIHPEEKVYNHTMLFGELLSGSNYNDEEDRLDISG